MKARSQRIAALALVAAASAGLALSWWQTPVDASWKQAHTYARLASPGRLTPGHAALKGDCEACHEPGAGATATRCIGCHVAEPAVMARPQTRFHADVTTCVSCHPEHVPPSIPTGESLHRKLGEAAAAATGTALVAGEESQDLDCVACHGRSEPHAGYFGDDCLSCHSTTTWSVPGYVHPPDSSGHCGECHKPPPNHFNPMFSAKCAQMLGSSRDVSDCDGCHLPAGWDIIRRAKWHRDTMSHRARRRPR